MTPIRVAAYLRVSTEEQAAGTYSSIDAQRDIIIRHVEHMSGVTDRKWVLSHTFSDEGYSGKSTKRPALNALKTAAAAGSIDSIVVYKLDRISRNVRDFLKLDEFLESHGVTLVSVREQFDTATPMGRALRILLLVFAQLERENLVQRVHDKFDAMVRAGVWAGGRVPFGFRRVEAGVLVVDESEAALVILIFQMYRDGLSITSICRDFNARGVPTRSGRPWRPKRVTEILTGACHYGRQEHGEREGAWPFAVIVPADLSAAVRVRLSSNRGRRGPNTIRYPWQRLCRCAVCFRAMSTNTVTIGGKRYQYLTCNNGDRPALNEARCPMPSLPVDVLARATGAVLAHAAKAQPPPRQPPPFDVARQLLDIEERRRRATASYNDPRSRMSDAEYSAVLDACDRQESRLKPDTERGGTADANSLRDAWAGLNVTDQNAALGSLVKALIVDREAAVVLLREWGWDRWPKRLHVPRDPRLAVTAFWE